MTKLRKALIDKAEELEWRCHIDKDDGSIDFENWSPAGEDIIVFVAGKDIAREVREYAYDFDADDHAEMWMESRGERGVPRSIRTLINDADEIQKMLDDLADALTKAEEAFYEARKERSVCI